MTFGYVGHWAALVNDLSIVMPTPKL